MVKQAEKSKKSSPMLPVLGLFLVIGLLVIAYILALLVVQIPQVSSTLVGLPQLKINDRLIAIGNSQFLTWGHVGFTLIFFVVLAGFAYFLVTVAVGKDPQSTKEIPLPPRDDKKPRRGR